MGRAYGGRMAEYFGAQRAPISTTTLALTNEVAFTHLKCDGIGTGLTEPIPPQSALLLCVQQRPLTCHDLWLDGRHEKVKPYPTGGITMLDMNSCPIAYLGSAFDVVHMYLPRPALDAVSAAEEVPDFADFPVLSGTEDVVLEHLAKIALAAMSERGPASELFMDALTLAVHRHLRQRYAALPTDRARRIVAGLTDWQEHRVKEYIEAHLAGPIRLIDLASLCGLSPSQFGRAFKRSVNMTPHQWLISRRVARARHLLLYPQWILSDIALQTGFVDQSHLTREFRRAEGMTPAAWRRLHVQREYS